MIPIEYLFALSLDWGPGSQPITFSVPPFASPLSSVPIPHPGSRNDLLRIVPQAYCIRDIISLTRDVFMFPSPKGVEAIDPN